MPLDTPTLIEDLRRDNLLNISLKALTSVISREVGLKNMSVTMSDEFKQELLRAGSENHLGTDTEQLQVKYPFGYFLVSELAPNKERVPFKNVRKHGWSMGTVDVTASTSQKAYLFPVILSLELHYFESSPTEALLISQALALLTGSSSFNFDITLGKGGIKYSNKIGFIDGVSIPLAETNSPNAPGGIEFTLPLVFETYTGFVRDVAAVNSSTPTVTAFSVTVGNDKNRVVYSDEIRAAP